ncbi:MAG TPA: hypothetical protein VNR42_02615 [Solirubrobacteraceae bacterium]|nr:hypothetical protein [Solirubrobacteraceae bacterium]
MPSAAEIAQQVETESERRGVLSVPAFAGGFLYVLSAIIISGTLKGAPTVGLVEGLGPAMSGVANPTVSPRASEVKFISHHAFTLIVGSVLAAIAVAALTLILLLLLDATRFRRPATWAAARPLVLFGGIAVAVVSVAHQVISAVQTHNFAVGHDFSNHAVNHALTEGSVNITMEYIDLLAGLALAAGVIATMINALRTGLLPRWMGILGIFSGLLIFLPLGGAELQVVPALWMVMMGILYAGRWPNAEPPAWAAGEARPWPSGAQARAAKSAGVDVVPAPSPPAQVGTSRKRRKRGARG